jgi:ATP-dependent exoDNAse (exonuclease V) alpha subunit
MKAKVNKRGGGFLGLIRYMKDGRKHEHSVKNALLVSTNMAGTSDRALEREFMAVRALRPDIKKPLEHHSIALQAGETLTPEQWDEVVRDYLAEMEVDVDLHQYIAMQHSDTEYQHVHIGINRIGLDGSVWYGDRSALRAIEATQKLERKYLKYGLKATKGLDPDKVDRALSRNEHKLAKSGVVPPRLQLAAIIREVRDRSKSFRHLVDGLAVRGVSISPNGLTGTVSGASFKFNGVTYTGSKVGKDCAWKALSTAVNYDPVADADLVAKLRAAREEDQEEQKDSYAAMREATALEDYVDASRAELFGTRSVIPMTRFERAMQQVHEFAPALSGRVAEQVKAELVELGPRKGVMVYTTKAVLERERRLIRNAQLLAGDTHHDLTHQQIEAAIHAKELDASRKGSRVVRMSEEQRAAVRYALRGGFCNVQGSAGAGKSFSAEAIRLAYEERDYQVLGAAVAKRAAQNLEAEAGIRSYTIAKLLSEVKGKRIVLDRKTCLVIDEAGQVGAGYCDDLLALAAKSGAKVVFTGEDRQTDAIQHGGVLRMLSRANLVGTARIQAIKRQREEWARTAVENFRDGKMDEGLKAFESRGLVNWVAGGTEAVHAALIREWREYELANPDKSALIVAHSNDDARELGRRVRQIRKAEGRVRGPEYEVPAQHSGKAYMLTLAQGDRVRFSMNAEDTIGVINGTLGTVLSIRPVTTADGKPDLELRVQTDDRGEVQLRLGEYSDEKGRAHLNQAYASTIYSAQGLTIDGDVFVYQTEGMDRANTYVAASRAKDSTRFFVDRDTFARAAHSSDDQALREALVQSMGDERGEPMATEVLEANDPGYTEREYGQGVDPETRAARELEMARAFDEDEEDTPIESYEDELQRASSDLWALDAVITKDRFEEAMLDVQEKAPQFADQARAELEPQLKAIGVDDGGRTLYTTDVIIERELQMVRDIRTLAADRHHDLDAGQVLTAIARKEESERSAGKQFTMSEEQRAGVAHTLRGGYASLQGSAGAGKSTAMDAVRLGHEQAGYNVYGSATSKKAAQNLEREANIESRTIARTLKDLEHGNLRLNERSVLVVDEAGQVSSGHLAAMARHCVANGSKLVFTGEDRQLDAVGHGGALRFLSRDDVVGTARIQTIFRQREEWARQAVANYRDGKTEAGLKAFEDRGLVHWVRGGSDATQDRLIQHWHQYELANPDKATLILAHSNAVARELGERVRAIRREEGRVVGPNYKMRGVHGDNGYDLTLAQGDRVRFTLNDEQGCGAINGTLATITSITPMLTDEGERDYLFKVKTDDRGELTFRASEYRDEKGRVHLNQAYSSTIYSAQGLTVDGNVYVYQTPGMDRANTYVSNSRARDLTHTYIDRDAAVSAARTEDQEVLRARLLQSMSRDDSKKLAIEVMSANDPEFLQRAFAGFEVDVSRHQHFECVVQARRAAEVVREHFGAEQAAQREAAASTPDAVATRERFAEEAEQAYLAKHGPALSAPASPAPASPSNLPTPPSSTPATPLARLPGYGGPTPNSDVAKPRGGSTPRAH